MYIVETGLVNDFDDKCICYSPKVNRQWQTRVRLLINNMYIEIICINISFTCFVIK